MAKEHESMVCYCYFFYCISLSPYSLYKKFQIVKLEGSIKELNCQLDDVNLVNAEASKRESIIKTEVRFGVTTGPSGGVA